VHKKINAGITPPTPRRLSGYPTRSSPALKGVIRVTLPGHSLYSTGRLHTPYPVIPSTLHPDSVYSTGPSPTPERAFPVTRPVYSCHPTRSFRAPYTVFPCTLYGLPRHSIRSFRSPYPASSHTLPGLPTPPWTPLPFISLRNCIKSPVSGFWKK